MASGRKPNVARRAQMARLRARGLTLAEIGRRLGVSPQCVYITLRSMVRPRDYSVHCSGCGAKISSAGALPSDASAALCLSCLARRPAAAFGERLKAFRLAAGLTKSELAERAGLAYELLRQYEGGTREPRWRHLLPLMLVLGADLVTLGLSDSA